MTADEARNDRRAVVGLVVLAALALVLAQAAPWLVDRLVPAALLLVDALDRAAS